MKSILIPVSIMAAFILLVSALTPQPQATAEPLITEVVQAEATGPGFFPVKDSSECKCANCNCDELEKRVAALESKVASYGSVRPSVTQASVGGSGQASVSRPVTTAGLPYGAVIVSERVVSTQATPLRQMQPAQPVRNTVRGAANTTCRIVNGVRVCN